MEENNWRQEMRWRLRLRLYRNDLVFGPGVAEVMERVRKTQSLSESCRQMGMAYSKGWKIIRRAETELGFPLMEGTRGGQHGGKMMLTPQGEELLEDYRSFERAVEKETELLFQKYIKKSAAPEHGGSETHSES